MAADGQSRILVIKLGALGDFVLAMGPFEAIRRHHGDAHIILLTTRPFAEIGRMSGYFDEVWIDRRPRLWQPLAWIGLRARLRRAGFARVYDLQTSDRSSLYFRLIGRGRRPEWSGIARGCSHPHANPNRDFMHTIERQAEQLAMAGIGDAGRPDLSWLAADVSGFGLDERFALLVPGGAAHRPEKRWPVSAYADLARRLGERDVRSVLIGAAPERDVLAAIARAAPAALDLCGRTSFAEIAELARRAVAAVGNDTGPMHLVAAVGCPSVVLFSAASDPALTAPRGSRVAILSEARLDALSVDRVFAALEFEDDVEPAADARSP